MFQLILKELCRYLEQLRESAIVPLTPHIGPLWALSPGSLSSSKPPNYNSPPTLASPILSHKLRSSVFMVDIFKDNESSTNCRFPSPMDDIFPHILSAKAFGHLQILH
jgi:hypothetical protein